jgi:hypothetical protein
LFAGFLNGAGGSWLFAFQLPAQVQDKERPLKHLPVYRTIQAMGSPSFAERPVRRAHMTAIGGPTWRLALSSQNTSSTPLPGFATDP